MNTWVQYFPGDCGTFVSWFISQHQGYIGAKAQLKVHDPVPNEVVCESTTWDWRAETWTQQQTTRVENYAGESIAFKTYTEHNCTNADDHTPEEMQQFWNRIHSVPNLNSVGLWVPFQHLYQFQSRLDHCFNSYDEGDSAETYYENRPDEYEELAQTHAQQFADVDLHWVDVHQLIIQESAEEYADMCEFLGVPELEHWRTLISFYRLQVFQAL